jgi:beta-aspartyl-peptidase (threonine type)
MFRGVTMQPAKTTLRNGALFAIAILALAAALALRIYLRSPPNESSTKAAIQRVLNDQVAAWNSSDLNGFMAGYWNDEGLTFFSGGKKTKGWQATLERYQRKYQGEGKEMGKLDFSEVEIDILGPNNALVRGRWRLELKKETKTVGGLFTLLFARKPDGWRIVHDHTSD